MVCIYGVEIKSNIDFKRLIFYLPLSFFPLIFVLKNANL